MLFGIHEYKIWLEIQTSLFFYKEICHILRIISRINLYFLFQRMFSAIFSYSSHAQFFTSHANGNPPSLETRVLRLELLHFCYFFFIETKYKNNLSRLSRLTDMCISSCIPTWILVQRCITPFCKLFFFKKVSINVEWLHLRGCSKTTLTRFWLFLTTYPPNGMNVDKFLDHLPNLSCKHSL